MMEVVEKSLFFNTGMNLYDTLDMGKEKTTTTSRLDICRFPLPLSLTAMFPSQNASIRHQA